MTNRLIWGNGHIGVEVTWSDNESPKFRQLFGSERQELPAPRDALGQSLVEVTIAAEGHEKFGGRYSETRVGRLMRYKSHTEWQSGGWSHLVIDLTSPQHGLDAKIDLAAPDGIGAIRAATTVTNVGESDVVLHSVSSFSGLVVDCSTDLSHAQLYTTRSDWLSENRWRAEPVREFELVDSSLALHAGDGGLSDVIMAVGGTVTRSSAGTRTTGAHLPMGALVDESDGRAVLWQIESNASWLWQLGERIDGVYLTMLGPTDIEHQWHKTLRTGESFSTVPAAVLFSHGGIAGAAAELTRYRRKIVRTHQDHDELPVIFNDYMNTLMGDPTTEVLLPLIDAAAEAGADYFCVDCGWYDDGGSWWPSVGEWQPSTTRFPHGLQEVTDHIRARGMRPGIWLEPEVVGVDSPMAHRLPDSAFIQRDGTRWRDHSRYHLDLRSTDARKHLDDTVDRLVETFGVGFFKLDYNITAGAGTDYEADSPGDGLLGASRALLDWIDGVLDRHPALVIESCSSGAMRMDYGILARTQLQSSSDQQDYRRYATIAASAPLALLPEQSGHWAYPQPSMDLEAVAFCMVNALLGRVYLSGYLNRMDSTQRALVAEAVAVHKATRQAVRRGLPYWPLGVPGWNDDVVALGLADGPTSLVSVWDRREDTDEPLRITLEDVPHPISAVDVLYPTGRRRISWDAASRELVIQREGTSPQATFMKLS